MTCPFCQRIADDDIAAASPLSVALIDAFPISPGHTLIAPKRCVADYFQLSPDERESLWAMVQQIKTDLDRTHAPAAYNIGFNSGPAAGQTVPHAHIHIIPRYPGDSEDPRGGIRWVLPDKAKYW